MTPDEEAVLRRELHVTRNEATRQQLRAERFRRLLETAPHWTFTAQMAFDLWHERVSKALAPAAQDDAVEWIQGGGIACATCGRSSVPCRSDGVVWTCEQCEPATEKCTVCNGTGRLMDSGPPDHWHALCPACPSCVGTGRMR